jgi:hypothetical protein
MNGSGAGGVAAYDTVEIFPGAFFKKAKGGAVPIKLEIWEGFGKGVVGAVVE